MISSDEFNNYVEEVDEKFDEEVLKGLALLDQEKCILPLQEARRLLVARWKELDAREDLDPLNTKHSDEIRRLAHLEEEDEDRLFSAFYDPLDQFEDLLGKYLAANLGL